MCLSGSFMRKIGPRNVALLRHLTITGDHELNEVTSYNLPLCQGVKNCSLGIFFYRHPGLANLQSLCLEFPTFDAWHDSTNEDFRLWLDELPPSVTFEIRQANAELNADKLNSTKLDDLSMRVSGCAAEWAALRAAATMRICCAELRFFHIGACRHGPLVIITRKPVEVTENFEDLDGMSRTQVVCLSCTLSHGDLVFWLGSS